MATNTGSMTPSSSSIYPVLTATVSTSSANGGTVTCNYSLQFYSTGTVGWDQNTSSSLTFTCGSVSGTNNSDASVAISKSGTGTSTLKSGSITVTGVGSGTKTWSLVWSRWNMGVSYGTTSFTGFNCSITGQSVSVPASATKCSAPTNFKVSAPSPCLTDRRSTLTLTWTKGSGGINNAFKHTELQWSFAGSEPWHSWTTSTGTSATDSYAAGAAGKNACYRIRTVGEAGEDYASDWVYSANTTGYIRLYPPPPTSHTVALNTTASPKAFFTNYIIPDRGSVYYANYDPVEGALYMTLSYPGAAASDTSYYKMELAYWSGGKNPLTDAPDIEGWRSTGGNIITTTFGSGCGKVDCENHAGMWLRYRVCAHKNEGTDSIAVDSPWVYSPLIRFTGFMNIKKDNKWIGEPIYIKVNGTWKHAYKIFVKQNNSWKILV